MRKFDGTMALLIRFTDLVRMRRLSSQGHIIRVDTSLICDLVTLLDLFKCYALLS